MENENKEKRLHLIVIASILLVAIAVGVVAAVFITKNTRERKHALYLDSLDRSFDFLSTDLSTYLNVTDDLYRNIAVTVSLDSVTDGDVENAILKTLAAHKGDKLSDEDRIAAEAAGRKLAAGDKVKIYYRGYTVEADGTEKDFVGGTNMSADSPSELELGSGNFIPGFESSLVGKDPASFFYDRASDGTVGENDVAFVSYSAFLPSAPSGTEVTSERISLSDPTIDETYGTGFRAYLLGLTVGKTYKDPRTFTIPSLGEDAVYYDLTVTYVLHNDTTPLTVDCYFPADYGADSDDDTAKALAATYAKFDVYLCGYTAYAAATLDDDFITKTLGMSEEDLADFAGDTLVEKYRAKVRADLDAAYEERKNDAIRSAMFNYYYDHADVLRLPVYHVTAAYEGKYAEMKEEYASYLLGQDENSDIYVSLRNYCYEYAVSSVTESLVYYGVLRHAGLLLDKDSVTYRDIYDRLLSKELQSYIDFYKVTPDSFKDSDGKTAAEKYAEWKEARLAAIAEEYALELEEDTYFEYAAEKLQALVRATVLDARDANR